MKASLIPKSKAKTAYSLLSEVRAAIIAEPKRYNQNWWLSKRSKGDANYEEPPNGYPACGTVGCVAGWVVTLKRARVNDAFDTENIAKRILGIGDARAHSFFHSGVVSGDPQTVDHAMNGAEHIKRFQRRHRAQLLAKKV